MLVDVQASGLKVRFRKSRLDRVAKAAVDDHADQRAINISVGPNAKATVLRVITNHGIVAFCLINFVKELLMTSENHDRIHERAAQHLESFLRRILSAPPHL